MPLPGRHLLVRGPRSGHARRVVVVLQGGRLLRGHQAAHLGAVGGGVLRVTPGGVVRGEGDRGLRRRGQVRGRERQPLVDLGAARGRDGRGRRDGRRRDAGRRRAARGRLGACRPARRARRRANRRKSGCSPGRSPARRARVRRRRTAAAAARWSVPCPALATWTAGASAPRTVPRRAVPLPRPPRWTIRRNGGGLHRPATRSPCCRETRRGCRALADRGRCACPAVADRRLRRPARPGARPGGAAAGPARRRGARGRPAVRQRQRRRASGRCPPPRPATAWR